MQDSFQIGEVAEMVGLSIRTIRHYDEMRVVEPSARSAGGFRLYTAHDIERLRLVKHIKPLRFSLEEIQELVTLHDRMDSGAATAADRERLGEYASRSHERCEELRQQLHAAESAARELTSATRRRKPTGSGSRS